MIKLFKTNGTALFNMKLVYNDDGENRLKDVSYPEEFLKPFE